MSGLRAPCISSSGEIRRSCMYKLRWGVLSTGKRFFRGGNLAYLASRRSSRDSELGEPAPLLSDRYRRRRTSNFLELPVAPYQRMRVSSLPEQAYNPRDRGQIYRLRTFSITDKGVVNQGDSIVSRSETSLSSVHSQNRSPVGSRTPIDGSRRNSPTSSRSADRGGNRSPFEGSCCGSSNHSSDNNPEDKTIYRVLMLGSSGVGKTSLINQFMTSEYMNTYDASLDDEFGEKSVRVLLDGEESEMIFIDHPAHEMSAENAISTYQPHACVVVYSVTVAESLQAADDALSLLWTEGYIKDTAVILTGNKTDLARARVISHDDGKSMALQYSTKFIETSSGMQHNVDELLVGVLKQIRLRASLAKKNDLKELESERSKYVSSNRTSQAFNAAKEALSKLCLVEGRSKSCSNLLVL